VAIGVKIVTSKKEKPMIRNIQRITSVLMFVALFDLTLNQILFWTTPTHHTPENATRIGSAGLLILAALILLVSIHNYKQIEKETD
jgi:hypothetical protein